MTEENQEIKDLYEDLKSGARSDVQYKLKKLKEVLDEHVENNVKTFSLQYVSDLASKRGGPAYQSIVNKAGKRYRTLFDKYVEIYEEKRLKPVVKSQDSWIDDIPDTASQYRVRRLQADLKKYKNENDTLRNLKSKIVLEVPNYDACNDLEVIGNQKPESAALPNLLTSEKETLLQLLDEKYLRRTRLHYNNKGALILTTEQNEEIQISDRKLQTALEKILTVLDVEAN
ncbi:gamma-mobile-trio protein GmtX [Planctobacterium marinum]|uniref:gamma-mobile-trio protein GmtX n=1 Tax=Planctobacterium marinum TaxID=1631968 RepID=UPI001E520EA1|nr:gamma-mobile-trio protein GmtX [Planctobacterium marinum]MCC2607933.1 hypothetical protein [Planctobacterium marinum]